MTFRTPNVPQKETTCKGCSGEKYVKSERQSIATPCKACKGSGVQDEARELPGNDGHIYMYVDQNVISDNREGRYEIPDMGIFDLSKQGSQRGNNFVVYVYSNETLIEIENSEYPDEYLTVLKTLQAQKMFESIDAHIRFLLNKRVVITGKVQSIFNYYDPESIYNEFSNLTNKKRRYINDVVTYAKTVLHVAGLLNINTIKFDFINLETKGKLEELSTIVNRIRRHLGTSHSEASRQAVRENPISEIWKKFISPKVVSPDITTDLFFGFDEVQGLYGNFITPHIVLNIIGYYPDKNRKIVSNISGFMSDVRHVNMASRTDVFLTYDRNLAHRASALYKWKDTKTGYHLMTVFKKFGKKDIIDYTESEDETYDQASDRWKLFYTNGKLSSANS